MKRSYELVIFDLDGTLLDTSAGVLSAVTHTLGQLSLPRPAHMSARRFIGPPIERSLASECLLSGETLTAAASEFRRHYAEKDLLKASPYEGVLELLAALRHAGRGRAVATYKREAQAQCLLWHHGLAEHMNVIHGSSDTASATKADIIARCVEDYGISDPARAVMVGDTAEDAEGALAAGVDFIGVTYGFGFADPAALGNLPHVGVAARPAEIFSIVRGE